MRNASTQMVYDLAAQDERVMAITADNRNEIYENIHRDFPKQYLDYGIAESNMIASAAGLASCGRIPFLYTITNFMSMRAFEFIRNDVCVGNQNVKFLGRSSGLISSNMGPTHQGTEELSLLRCLPNLLVITPVSPREAREATRFAYQHYGPVYIRLEGLNEPEYFGDDYIFTPGNGSVLRPGKDITLFSMGSIVSEALIAAQSLSSLGIEMNIINMPTVRPIDEQKILKAIGESKGIITLEEHSVWGGLGSAVAEVIAESSGAIPFKRLGLRGCASGSGFRQEVRSLNGLAQEDIIRTVKEMLS